MTTQENKKGVGGIHTFLVGTDTCVYCGHQQNQEKRTWRETEVLMQQAKENQECTCSSIGLNTPSDCPVHKNMWENQEKEFKKMLGEKAHITKEHSLHYSHYHCWDQTQPSACGIPLEKHTQCCLCDVQYARGAGGAKPENQEKVTKFELSDGNELRIFGDASWQVMVRQPENQEIDKITPENRHEDLWENQEKYTGGIDAPEGDTKKALDILEGIPPENQESYEWEKEFDNLFWLHRVPKNTKQMADIKSFIANLLSSQKSSLVEEIEDNYERMLVDNPGDGKSYEAMVYNKGMEVFKKRVLALLKRD